MRSVVWVSYGKSKTFSIFDIHIKSSWLRRIKTHKAPLRKVAKRVKNKSGLKEMTIAELEKMWEELEVIPINNNDEIESDFFLWEKGTSRFEIWHWFDEKLTNGLVADFDLA